MRENEVTFQKGLFIGLRPSENNVRNVEALVVSNGMFPEEGALRAVDVLACPAAIVALGEVFPFPQLWFGQVHTLIMGATKIWEYVNNACVLKLSGLTTGSLWTVADFGDSMFLTNGVQMIARDAEKHTWSVLADDDYPLSNCVVGINGQMFYGSPKIG